MHEHQRNTKTIIRLATFFSPLAPLLICQAQTIARLDISNSILKNSSNQIITKPHLNNGSILNSKSFLSFNYQETNRACEQDILVTDDHPILTGHHDQGKGYESLLIQVYFRIHTAGENMTILEKKDGNLGYELYITQDSKVSFRITTPQGSRLLTTKNQVKVGQWHQIQAIWDENVWRYNCQIALDNVIQWGACKLGPLNDTKHPLTIAGSLKKNQVYKQFVGDIKSLTIGINRSDLFNSHGNIDYTPIKPTGSHLTKQPGFISSSFIFNPPVTPECHASTIVELKNKQIASAWFGGTHEGHIDTSIWLAFFDGHNWTIPKSIAHGKNPNGSLSASFNPVLYQAPENGPLMLFFLSGKINLGNLLYSHDNASTWTKPALLPNNIKGATKNPPILANNGVLICPDNSRQMKFHLSNDFGKTWTGSTQPAANEYHAIQPTILKYRDGQLQALARSREYIIQSWSNDHGVSWSAQQKTSLPNNNSGICATTLRDGRQLLVYNHATTPKGSWGGKRTPLNIAITDNGEQWYAAIVLEDEIGEFSYPAVTQANDGLVHVTYTWNRTRIKHAILDPDEFKLKPITDGHWPQD